MKKSKAFDPSVIKMLRAAGCPVPLNEWKDLPQDLRISVEKSGTKVYGTKCAAEYEFDLRIENCSYGIIEIQGFECHLPGHSSSVRLLGLRNDVSHEKAYRLPSGKEFALRQVLNHRIGRLGVIEPHETLEGLLLAHCIHPCGSHVILTASSVPAEISILDQHGRWHFTEIEVDVDRSETIKDIRKTRPLDSGLYGPSGASLTADIPGTRTILNDHNGVIREGHPMFSNDEGSPWESHLNEPRLIISEHLT